MRDRVRPWILIRFLLLSCLHIFISVLWCSLRFPCKSDMQFVFTSIGFVMGSCFICVICTSGTAYTSGMCGGSCCSIFSLVSSGPLFFCLFFFIWFIHSDSIYRFWLPIGFLYYIVNTEVMWAILLRHMFHTFDKVNSIPRKNGYYVIRVLWRSWSRKKIGRIRRKINSYQPLLSNVTS